MYYLCTSKRDRALCFDGGCSSVVEHLIVVQGVAGSNPVFHPPLG